MGNILVGNLIYTQSTNVTLEVDKKGSSLLPTLLQVVLYMKIENAFICPCEIGTASL